MTYSEAQTYIKSPKKVIDVQGNKLEKVKLDLTSSQKMRVHFKDDDSKIYVLDVFHSDKVGIKMSFHLRDGNQGLTRIDYYGPHTNPSPYTADVPEIFKPYEGKVFNLESHLHQFVENYDLEWALPIEVTDIEPKTIDAADSNQGFKDAFLGFCNFLNVTTEIELL